MIRLKAIPNLNGKEWIALGVLLVGAATLVWFPPEQYGFYPRCPFFEATGLLCPGCGGHQGLGGALARRFQRRLEAQPADRLTAPVLGRLGSSAALPRRT